MAQLGSKIVGNFGAEVIVFDVQGSMQARKAQEEALAQAEMRRKMRQTVVPTDDGEVRALLRRLGEPITLFGEREVWSVTAMHNLGSEVHMIAILCSAITNLMVCADGASE